jgi:pimeloyl-ACP methyl ester carboxylesterase
MVSGLSATDRGQGPVVLALHGQPGSAEDWEAVVAELAVDHRVLVPDRPGYGLTGGDALGMAANADVLADFLMERAAVPATIVGHSYGGGIAVLIGLRRPDVVSGLVLVGSVGRADSVNVLDHALALPWAGELLTAAGLLSFGRLLPRLRGLVTHVPGRRLAWLEANIPDRRPRGDDRGTGRQIRRSFVAEQRALVREIVDVESALDHIRVPTVVISGIWDVVVPVSVAATIATDVAGAELVTVPRTGHFVPRDAPQVVAAAVRRVEARSTGEVPGPYDAGEVIEDTGA